MLGGLRLVRTHSPSQLAAQLLLARTPSQLHAAEVAHAMAAAHAMVAAVRAMVVAARSLVVAHVKVVSHEASEQGG
jgi:hypothetical protein